MNLFPSITNSVGDSDFAMVEVSLPVEFSAFLFLGRTNMQFECGRAIWHNSSYISQHIKKKEDLFVMQNI
jgi:hypothetical protein